MSRCNTHPVDGHGSGMIHDDQLRGRSRGSQGHHAGADTEQARAPVRCIRADGALRAEALFQRIRQASMWSTARGDRSAAAAARDASMPNSASDMFEDASR